MRIIAFLILGIISCQLYAAAGKAIFVYGDVQIINEDGEQRKLVKNDEVNQGDLIVTGIKGLAQLRMIDKGFIAIRSNSEFKIENFRLGETKEEDSGLFSLLKGGFRAITGLIGKRLRAAYQVNTITATIGIRGTDYTVRLCNQDCNSKFGIASSRSAVVEDGLYVGVIEGGILLTNDLGTLDLDELQYGYVKNARSAPVALLGAPEFLFFKSRPPSIEGSEDDDDSASNIDTQTIAQREAIEPEPGDINSDSSIQRDINVDQTEPSVTEIDQASSYDQEVVLDSGVEVSLNDGTMGTRRSVVSGLGDSSTSNSISSVTENFFSSTTIENQALTGFENDYLDGGTGKHNIGSATTLDLGFDPATGISWGRWSTGTASFVDSSNGSTTSIDLTGRSLHWISGPDRADDIALPSTGTINYQLVGNTNPTDNLGNTGILGAASLIADFTDMTTTSSVDISINSQVWSATGSSGVIQTNGEFTGSMSVTGTDPTGTFSGTGSNAGFFTNNAEGAGMGYSLEATISGIPTNVTGTAAFQQ